MTEVSGIHWSSNSTCNSSRLLNGGPQGRVSYTIRSGSSRSQNVCVICITYKPPTMNNQKKSSRSTTSTIKTNSLRQNRKENTLQQKSNQLNKKPISIPNELHKDDKFNRSSRDTLLNKDKNISKDASATRRTFKTTKQQNFTIASPPISRKLEGTRTQKLKTIEARERTRTRTLKPEEIIIGENVPKIPDDLINTKINSVNFSSIPMQENMSNTSTSEELNNHDGDNIGDDYESEFESYESDFESDSSKHSANSPMISEPSNEINSRSTSSSSNTDTQFCFETEVEDIKFTCERKLDSGNYDIKMKQALMLNENLDLNYTLKQNINQPDSGLNSGLFDIAFNGEKFLLRRYADILDRVSFNTMHFDFFETRPVSYEYFVGNYGKSRRIQNHTQTETEVMLASTQTEPIYYKSCWVQNPPRFSKEILLSLEINHNGYAEEKLGVGQESFHIVNQIIIQDDSFNEFIRKLELKHDKHAIRHKFKHVTKSEMNKLRLFLQKSYIFVKTALNRNFSKTHKNHNKGTINLNNYASLSNCITLSAYMDSDHHDRLATIHECYGETGYHQYAVCIWNKRYFNQPECVLTCWENVVCSERVGQIYIGGTSHGTLCLWNIEKCDSEIMPFQITSPAVSTVTDCGGVIAIKSLDHTNRCKTHIMGQILTLFETGLLVTWTLSLRDQHMNFKDQENLNTVFYHANHLLFQQNFISLHKLSLRDARLQNPSHYFKMGYQNETIRVVSNKSKMAPCFPKVSFSNLFIYGNKAIISSHDQILIVNHLEQKITTILKSEYSIRNVMQHTAQKEYVFITSPQNMIKIKKIIAIDNKIRAKTIVQCNGIKQQSLHNSHKIKSSISIEKSCAIQNIVKSERQFFLGTSGHQDNSFHTLGSYSLKSPTTVDTSLGSSQIQFYHNKILSLKHLSYRDSSVFFLNQGNILGIVTENSVKLIDLKTKQKGFLNKYIKIDLANHRLIAASNKEILTACGKEIRLIDISSHSIL
ncbi:uncharacterized protein LOC131434914 isoform X2 [Malaya genurostris]|uniref:uncharacterized protein LOC131434914 isoform X2 n=1 Tax=Malaya genurostris TaxID=325434 RepID=UPI0026F3D9F1|nr:uncharacterized protein LOC131434914 isoform X2 [Malaya genurostris]